MAAYKSELLKAEAPEVTQEDDTQTEPEEHKELSEMEKDSLVREELAQLRANLLAKKKREKKKVCCLSLRLCILYVVYVALESAHGPGRIPVVLAINSSFGMYRINPPDSRYAPILIPDSFSPFSLFMRLRIDLGWTSRYDSVRSISPLCLHVGGIQSPFRFHSVWIWSLNRPAIEFAERDLQPSAVGACRTIKSLTVLVLRHYCLFTSAFDSSHVIMIY